jgi:predicted phosphodiesterase
VTRPACHAPFSYRAAAPPRVVLFWIIVTIAVALGLYAVAPWILPLSVVEGPLVQNPTTDAVSLVWFTSRSGGSTLEVRVDDDWQAVTPERDGRRQIARVTGLSPGSRYEYRIREEYRVLEDERFFETAKSPGAAFTFIVMGDSGRGSRVQYALASQMLRHQPAADFVLHTGDVVYPSGAMHDYNAKFFVPYRAMIERVALWPCVGNHDVDDEGAAPAYSRVFVTPENGPADQPEDHNYWFDYGDARVLVLDSNVPEAVLKNVTAPWAEQVLADDAPAWKFVSFHHPPYTAGKYSPDERIQRTLVPIFEATGVDVVFNGHDHMYQRLGPLLDGEVVSAGEGILYIVTGAGGAALYEPQGAPPPYLQKLVDDQHSYTHVAVTGADIRLRQIDVDGNVLDEVNWSKAEPTSAPAGAGSATRPAGDGGD